MYYLGIDVGGTSCKLGLITPSGSIIASKEYSVSFDHYQTPILETVLRSAELFLGENESLVPELAGIGISATGQINVHSGTVVGTAGHLPNYLGSAFKEEFEQRYHLPVHVINDANSVAVAEQWLGRAKGYRHAIILTLGTGVGGGVIVDSHILNGQIGIAGELGHISIKKDGPLCTCGNHGCFENYASTTALLRLVREHYSETHLAVAPEEINGKIIFAEAAAGNEVIRKLLDQWISDIACGIVNLVHIFNPQIVVIGGGVSSQEELLIQPLREKVFAQVMPRFRDALQLEAASLKNDAGMIGAIYSFVNVSSSSVQ
jgi:glucokinase